LAGEDRLVVVDDLDFVGMAILPNETDSPLIVDPNAELTLPVTR
jgi:hypothetical protein